MTALANVESTAVKTRANLIGLANGMGKVKILLEIDQVVARRDLNGLQAGLR